MDKFKSIVALILAVLIILSVEMCIRDREAGL